MQCWLRHTAKHLLSSLLTTSADLPGAAVAALAAATPTATTALTAASSLHHHHLISTNSTTMATAVAAEPATKKAKTEYAHTREVRWAGGASPASINTTCVSCVLVEATRPVAPPQLLSVLAQADRRTDMQLALALLPPPGVSAAPALSTCYHPQTAPLSGPSLDSSKTHTYTLVQPFPGLP